MTVAQRQRLLAQDAGLEGIAGQPVQVPHLAQGKTLP